MFSDLHSFVCQLCSLLAASMVFPCPVHLVLIIYCGGFFSCHVYLAYWCLLFLQILEILCQPWSRFGMPLVFITLLPFRIFRFSMLVLCQSSWLLLLIVVSLQGCGLSVGVFLLWQLHDVPLTPPTLFISVQISCLALLC